MLPVTILAGGLATRLLPLSSWFPKALVPINGEPFIAHQLRLLRCGGVERVVLCLGYYGQMIEDFVKDGSGFGLQVEYSFDGTTPLGTAGALKRALPLLGDAFMVLYGDSYLDCPYRKIEKRFLQCGNSGLMTVYRNENRWGLSNVEFEAGRILAYDKGRPSPEMRHIDFGLGIFRASAFDDVPQGKFYDLAAVYGRLLAQNDLAAFEVPHRFYEVGSYEGIRDLCERLRP